MRFELTSGLRSLILGAPTIRALKVFDLGYSVFHQFRQAKFAYGGYILSSSQFLLLTQLALKKTLAIKVVKIDTEKINSLPGSKSVKQTVLS
jgi:hypothetical protein